MGNNWFGPSKPNNQIEQPKFFGKLPDSQPISKIQPTLTIYTCSGNDFVLEISHEQTMDSACESIRLNKIFFDPNLTYRLVMLTHGFRSTKHTEWLHEMKDAILSIDDSTTDDRQVVAIVGWGHGADIGLFNYGQASSNSIEVGRWLGSFLRHFRQEFPNVKTYGIGHSLGAHLMGMAGRSSHGSLDRITGLDPAGPGFQVENHDKRLNGNDAQLVDVIHTDGQDVPYFGTLVPLGNIDFYPNYGWDQPSNDGKVNAKPMIQRDKNQRKLPIVSEYGGFISESHGRAIEFFTWSISNPGKFRTHWKLEGQPDVEVGVHRIQAIPLEMGVQVEMGYYLDKFIERQWQEQCQNKSQILQPRSQKPWDQTESFLEPEEKNIQKLNERQRLHKFWGNYYVHTNGKAPWC